MTTNQPSYKPSDTSIYRAPNEFGSVSYSVKDIEKEREFLAKKKMIIEQFKAIDRNSDLHITLDEWLAFLRRQVSP